MSRIGKQPIPVPDTVTVSIEPELVRVSGPRGELQERISRELTVEQSDGELIVKRPTDRGEHRALHGLTRSLIANMVEGVTEGFEKRLEIQGVGYLAALRGRDIELSVGFSHTVTVKAGQLQASGGGDRRADPQGPAARAVQGQGHPLPRRVRRPEGGQARMTVQTKEARRFRRRRRVRAKVRGSAERPRLSVFRSNRGIRAQLIDDDAGHTLAAVAWTEPELRGLAPLEQAGKAGQLLAARAKEAGAEGCVFDRGGYLFHGRVKALAEAAREAGLRF